jgi:hypothetical protein
MMTREQILENSAEKYFYFKEELSETPYMRL